ncbi:hypothetical protein H311_04632, partial [Anncaliia algerae PRA109]
EFKSQNGIHHKSDKEGYNDIIVPKKAIKEEYNSRTIEYMEFEVCIPGTKVSIKKKLPYISTLKNYEVNDWLRRFEEIKELSEWNDSTAILVLKELFKDLNVDLRQYKENYNELRKHIINIAYPKDYTNLFLSNLEKIKQINYVYIKDYLADIERSLEFYSIAADLTKKEYERKLEESFLRGLGQYTTLEIAKFNYNTLEEIMKYLMKLETTIMMSQEKSTKFTHLHGKNDTFKNTNEKSPSFYRSKKYCNIHKTNSHSNKECYL